MRSSPPFDLEKALATWRRSLHWHRSLSEEDREELEQHIRDQVEALMIAGYTEQAAYRQALREMGPGHVADAAYRKNLSWTQTMAVRLPMLKNYARLGYRNLKKNTVASAINIVGLSLAIAVCIVVYLFLRDYRGVDHFHVNGPRIFLVEHTRQLGSTARRQGWTPAPLGPALHADFPQVERMVRVTSRSAQVHRAAHGFSERVSFADPGFFEMFTFPLKSGTPSALADPQAVVLSEAMALKYFGVEDPLGQRLTLTFDETRRETFIVQGVAAAFPRNAGFAFDFLLHLEHLDRLGLARLSEWDTSVSATFVQLREPDDAAHLAGRMTPYVTRQNSADAEQPVQSFYFDNVRDPLPGAHTVVRRFVNTPSPFEIAGFMALALAMLALSCFNYVNIALGSAARRLKEIGMRKVMGGRRGELIIQFLMENVVVCLIALLVGVVVARYLLIPLLGQIPDLPGERLTFSWTHDAEVYVFLVGLLVVVGLASGAYPAFYISSFAPTVVFRGKQKFANKKGLTYTLLTIQFVLTFVTVLFGTLSTSFNAYQKTIDWGYNPDPTVVVELTDSGQYALFREALLQRPEVAHVEGAVDPVGVTARRADVTVGEVRFRPLRYRVGPTYMEALGLRLKSGRLFDEQLHEEAERAVVVNETFVKEQGWDEPVGQMIDVEGVPHSIVGVIDDFVERGAMSLFLEEATVFQRADASAYAYASIQVKTGTHDETAASLEASWERLFPGLPFQYVYQSHVFEEERRGLDVMTRMLYGMAGVALLIACMGLFGLSSQNSARRLKEVGIRKVLGASVTRLVLTVNRGFIILLTVAAGLTTAVLYGGIRMAEEALGVALPVGPAPFLAAYALVLGTAAVAVALQTYTLVTVNPADVLRHD